MLFYLAKDWGSITAIAAASGVPTEMDAANAKGWYKIAVTQTESNADAILFSGKSSTANISVVGLLIQTLPAAMAIAAGAAGGLFIAGTNAATTVTTSFTTTFTGNLTGSVDSVTTKTGFALTAGERTSIADAIIMRNVAGGSSTGRIVKHALAVLRNRVAVAGGVGTVYEQDDTTPMWEFNVTTAAGNPISEIAPTT